MSGAERPTETIQLRRAGREAQLFGTIVVCGGGCYGSYYVRQLTRAAAAGAVRWDRLLVVDRDADCRVAAAGADLDRSGAWRAPFPEPERGLQRTLAETERAGREPDTTGADHPGRGAPPRQQHATDQGSASHQSPAPRVVVSPWTDFFDAYLGDAVEHPAAVARDAIVPSPLMPHLMFEWLLRRAAARWPSRTVAALPLADDPGTPWYRHAESGTYVSFAEWMCPINCIEPERCPETRGPRDWSVGPAVERYVRGAAASGPPITGPALLRCMHRAYGVGMFDTAAVIAADAMVAAAGSGGEARVLVGTVSHCHGALGLLHVGA